MSLYYEDEFVELHHGDCRAIRGWTRADVLVTDPPYGMSYQSGRKAHLAISGDATTAARDEVLALWGNRPALVFGTWKQPRPSDVRQLIVWDKRGGAGFSGDLKMPWADITEEIYVRGSGWVGGRVPAIYSIPTFAGSGATLIAARNLGRKAIGVELEERYCELIVKRLSQQAFDFSALEGAAS